MGGATEHSRVQRSTMRVLLFTILLLFLIGITSAQFDRRRRTPVDMGVGRRRAVVDPMGRRRVPVFGPGRRRAPAPLFGALGGVMDALGGLFGVDERRRRTGMVVTLPIAVGRRRLLPDSGRRRYVAPAFDSGRRRMPVGAGRRRIPIVEPGARRRRT